MVNFSYILTLRFSKYFLHFVLTLALHLHLPLDCNPNPGSSGFAYLGSVCDKDGRRFSVNNGYGPGSCQAFDPPEPIDCTPTNRVMLTAEVM